MRQLTTFEVVETLLDSYSDALDTLDKDADGDIAGKPSSKCLLMAPMWRQGSYEHLEHALRDLRSQRPRTYWHVAGRYLRAPSRIVTGCSHCRQPKNANCHHQVLHGGRLKWVKFSPERISVRVVAQAVSPTQVELGVGWLVDWFTARNITPFLPMEIYASVAA